MAVDKPLPACSSTYAEAMVVNAVTATAGLPLAGTMVLSSLLFKEILAPVASSIYAPPVTTTSTTPGS
jgi:hypothetical protein